MDKIVATKGVLGGKKRISGTRISVDLIYNYVIDNNIDQIYIDYPHLNKNQVKTALDYLDKKLHYAKDRVDFVPA